MRLSVFDLDHTLLTINSSFEYYSFLRKTKVLSVSSVFYSLAYVVSYLYFKMSPFDLHHKVFQKFLKGRKALEFIKEVDLFWKSRLNFFYEPALARLKQARAEGHFVLILSNSPDFLIEPIINMLKADSWNASRYNIDEEGKFSSISRIMDGAEKAKFTLNMIKKLKIDRKRVTVHSDSIHDRPLFEVAGTKVAVKPDKELRLLAEKEKWVII